MEGGRPMGTHWTNRMWVKLFSAPILSGAVLFAGCDGTADPAPTAPTDVPDWVGSLLSGPALLQADPTSTQEELPGMGRKFQLFHVTIDAQDPQNSTNDVIQAITTAVYPDGIGLAVRNLRPGISVDALTSQMNLKYLFTARTCAGGSPRFQVAIDGNGDGAFDQFTGGPDQNAFGYVGHAPFGAGCLTGVWDVIDMTDDVGRWDLSQLGGGMTMTWSAAAMFINANFPNHRVISGALVDDSCSFAPTSCGTAYYDLVTLENRTLENDQDTVSR